jgi:transposase-like protein
MPLVQERRDGTTAKRFFRRLLKGLQYKPKRLMTDALRSYGGKRAVSLSITHIVRGCWRRSRCPEAGPSRAT